MLNMWELDQKGGGTLKNWCFCTVVLEKTLESPLDSKNITPVYPKGNQSWTFIRRTDAEAEIPILWLPDVNSWLIRKDPDAGKDWGQEVKGVTEDKIDGITNSVNMNLSKIREIMKDREAWYATVNGISKNQTLLGNWTTATKRQERIRNYDIIQELFSHIRTFFAAIEGTDN